jgi:hypothetical protein
MAASSDLSWDPAPPSRSARLIRWYLHHLLALMPTDPEVASRFVRVQNHGEQPHDAGRTSHDRQSPPPPAPSSCNGALRAGCSHGRQG